MKSDDEWIEVEIDEKWRRRFRFSPEAMELRENNPVMKIRIIKRRIEYINNHGEACQKELIFFTNLGEEFSAQEIIELYTYRWDIEVSYKTLKTGQEIERHISTQANNTNYATYNFWYKQGASRVVSARELSMEELKELRANIPEDLEIETFIHGAMCISYSGRCLLSNYFTGRAANRGACTHPCRWKYAVVEEKRPGEYLPVYENERGTYIFNSKDLCMIEHIPELIDAGIDSLKIEGRMKTALYVATVARTYRKAIDDYKKDPKLYEQNMPWYKEQISNCTYRQFTTGFFFGTPDETTQIYDSNTYNKEYTYLGIVGEIKDGLCRIEQRNKFSVGETIEIMKPDGRNIEAEVLRILNEEGKEQESAPHSKQLLYVELSEIPDVYDSLRRKEEESK